MDLENFFEKELNQRLQESPELFEGSSSSYELSIDDYICHLNLENSREIKTGPDGNAKCKIQMSEKDFEKMIDGKLNIPLALAMRKIKVSGDLVMFAKLRELFRA